MAKRNREEAARHAAHWRARALEFQRLARGPERSMFKRAAEQGKAIAGRFERANHFASDFAITVDDRPVYAEIDGKPVSPSVFPIRLGFPRPLVKQRR
jgi:hypothetical protein